MKEYPNESLRTIEQGKIRSVAGKIAGYKAGDHGRVQANGNITFNNNLPPKYAGGIIAHRMDTEHGQKGSPVWFEVRTETNAKSPILVGLYSFGRKAANCDQNFSGVLGGDRQIKAPVEIKKEPALN